MGCVGTCTIRYAECFVSNSLSKTSITDSTIGAIMERGDIPRDFCTYFGPNVRPRSLTVLDSSDRVLESSEAIFHLIGISILQYLLNAGEGNCILLAPMSQCSS
jgi:hypothetical protein